MTKLSGGADEIIIRPARVHDVIKIEELTRPFVERRVLIPKELVTYYESLPELRVAECDGQIVGVGAMHVMWRDLGEVRTLAVSDHHLGAGIGGRLLSRLLDDARALGVSQVFCLTFEVDFFTKHGFEIVDGPDIAPEVFAEMVRSRDEGVAEYLDLARVKPNTLGNTRMILKL